MKIIDRIAEKIAARIAPQVALTAAEVVEKVCASIDEVAISKKGQFLATQLHRILNAPHRVEEGSVIRLSRQEADHLRRLVAEMGVE